MNYVNCPYCEEKDFDLIGLKIHLIKYCEIYEKTPIELLPNIKPIRTKVAVLGEKLELAKRQFGRTLDAIEGTPSGTAGEEG